MAASFRPTAVLLSAKSQPPSSRTWLARHFQDPYVRKRLSDPRNYRSRSAFKLIEIEDKHQDFLRYRDVKAVVDLGAAPGGWSQVAAGCMGYGSPSPADGIRGREGRSRIDHARLDGQWGGEDTDQRGVVIAVDKLHMQPIEGVHTLQMDFLSPEAAELVHDLLRAKANNEGKADVIMSDMAANMSGNGTQDSAACLDICCSVWNFTRQHLRTAQSVGRLRGGVLILKHFAHPRVVVFRRKYLDPNFHTVLYIKPDASRSASSEGYWLCMGYRPTKSSQDQPITVD
ncbi:23S ribosomal RNA methyltransferase [Stereum hirsutum FP-91666 SS1]|uniref:23S ribosomal RNA methyltransferase n=1 Tax=Stereum hirsutum (strain FP-91666) TaxID=721885 RepID=UPI000444A296|nr:23S ribosomal RNA methyltransferase [Stereum hirsutum FP-91666 SS1]EIM80644.1 23S ribosomal RNA methyltransferase [Stereum hirsutum FP-91666 SS1]